MNYVVKPFEELKDALSFFAKNWIAMLLFGLISNVTRIDASVLFLFPGFKLAENLFVGMVLMFLYLIVIQASCIYINNRMKNEPVSFMTSFALTRQNMTWFFLYSFIYVVITLAGVLLFLIPGFYYGTIYALGVTITAIEKKDSSISPLKKSAMLVKGDFWPVGIISLVTLIACAIPGVLIWPGMPPINVLYSAIIYTIVFPFSMIIIVSIYRKLSFRKEGTILPEKIKRMGNGLGCFLMVLILMFSIVASVFVVSQLNKFELFRKVNSIPIVISGQTYLIRPGGWAVSKATIGYPGKYTLSNPELKRATGVLFEDTGVESKKYLREEPSAGSAELAGDLLYECITITGLKGDITRDDCEPQNLRYLDIDGWKWASAEIQKRITLFDEPLAKIYKAIYTVQNGRIYVVEYNASIHNATKNTDLILFRADEIEIEKMLDALNIPETVKGSGVKQKRKEQI